MAAAAARLPGVFSYGPFAFFGIAFLFLATAIAYDYGSRGSIHRAYLWGGAVLIVSVPGACCSPKLRSGWRSRKRSRASETGRSARTPR
jgi:hypothetical protein